MTRWKGSGAKTRVAVIAVCVTLTISSRFAQGDDLTNLSPEMLNDVRMDGGDSR